MEDRHDFSGKVLFATLGSKPFHRGRGVPCSRDRCIGQLSRADENLSVSVCAVHGRSLRRPLRSQGSMESRRQPTDVRFSVVEIALLNKSADDSLRLAILRRPFFCLEHRATATVDLAADIGSPAYPGSARSAKSPQKPPGSRPRLYVFAIATVQKNYGPNTRRASTPMSRPRPGSANALWCAPQSSRSYLRRSRKRCFVPTFRMMS
jgi:hypothetical protein